MLRIVIFGAILFLLKAATEEFSADVSSTRYNYSEALRLSILFYDAQRSGKLPANNPIPWRHDSGLNDSDGNIDLTGGWYDAGDHVKFNFPQAAATLNLLWGLEKWKDAYVVSGQLDMMYDMIKWPLEYFLKCWIPNDNAYYFQIGDIYADHHYWGRPEDMNMSRPAFKATIHQPGSDVAGETAAALAAASIVFNETDVTFSTNVLTAAKSLYSFAKNYLGLYTDYDLDFIRAYRSSGYRDELCEGAAWLYKATHDEKYLKEAKFSTIQEYLGVFRGMIRRYLVLLYEITKEDQYKSDVQNYMKSWMPGGFVPYTPCGLAWRSDWGSLRYAANTVFVALLAVDDGLGGDEYKKWALSQINYILGDNNYNMSYEIGFGSNYPTHPHHRGSSCPDNPNPCDFSQLNSPAPSPHVLLGGLVGGPGKADDYADNRSDYVKNEVAVDYNAGFQSSLAGLIHFATHGELPAAPAAIC